MAIQIAPTQFWWEILQREQENSARCVIPVVSPCCLPSLGVRPWRHNTAALLSYNLLTAWVSGQGDPWIRQVPGGLPVTPCRMPMIVACEDHLLPSLGARLGYDDDKEEEWCADTVNEIQGPVSSSGGKMETLPEVRFPQSHQYNINQRSTGLCLPNIHSPLPQVTPAWLFFGKMPYSPSQSPAFTEGWCRSPRCRGWSHKPGLTNQCVPFFWPHWLTDWWMDMPQTRKMLDYQSSVGTTGRERPPFAGPLKALRIWTGLAPTKGKLADARAH